MTNLPKEPSENDYWATSDLVDQELASESEVTTTLLRKEWYLLLGMAGLGIQTMGAETSDIDEDLDFLREIAESIFAAGSACRQMIEWGIAKSKRISDDSLAARVSARYAWILTYMEHKFYPLCPEQSTIVIEDIAHALAHQCRFAGHTDHFYSVAQHSVLVSQSCPSKYALDGLLHDAAKAYLGDITRPVKKLACMAEFREAEQRLERAIRQQFGLADELPQYVVDADRLLLVTEARDLMPSLPPEWMYSQSHGYPALPYPIKPLGSSEAEQLFLDEFDHCMELREAEQAKGGA